LPVSLASTVVMTMTRMATSKPHKSPLPLLLHFTTMSTIHLHHLHAQAVFPALLQPIAWCRVKCCVGDRPDDDVDSVGAVRRLRPVGEPGCEVSLLAAKSIEHYHLEEKS
jgi:hypothetical protein